MIYNASDCCETCRCAPCCRFAGHNAQPQQAEGGGALPQHNGLALPQAQPPAYLQHEAQPQVITKCHLFFCFVQGASCPDRTWWTF